MALGVVPAGIEKVKRSQFLTFLDTTPSASSSTFAMLGVGITEYGIAYNPQVDTEKWIVEDNARTTHQSNQKQSSVSQKIYKGDPCFEFVSNGRDVLNYRTKVLDIDAWNGTGNTYPATLSEAVITITNYMGEDATIEYDLYYDGDAKKGTATIVDGVPTFVENASL